MPHVSWEREVPSYALCCSGCSVDSVSRPHVHKSFYKPAVRPLTATGTNNKGSSVVFSVAHVIVEL
jgi:hypothetical protein